jgi:hypothetical protein
VLHDFLSALSLSNAGSVLIRLNKNFDVGQMVPKQFFRLGKVALMTPDAA